MIDTTFDQAKIIITKNLDNWNSNFWRLRWREQVNKQQFVSNCFLTKVCSFGEQNVLNFGESLRNKHWVGEI